MRSSGFLPLAVFAAAVLVSQQSALGQFAITTPSLPNALVNASYSQPLTTNADQSIVKSWSITVGALPPGLTLGNASGLIGGIPTTGGTFQFTVRVSYTFQGDTGPTTLTAIKPFQIVVVAPPPVMQKVSPPDGIAGVPYPSGSFPVNAGTGAIPFTFSSTPQPPIPGLTLSSSGLLSGTPTRAGTFNFTITVTDSLNRQASTIYTVTIRPKLNIATTSLPGGTVGALYVAVLGASGGIPPYTWYLTAGALPAGVSLSPTGTLSGTPTVSGFFPITVQAVDSPQADYDTQNLNLFISSAVSITTDTLPTAIPGAAYSATLTTSGGIAPFNWSVVKGALPAGMSLNPATGTITGVPTALGTSTFTVQVTDAANVSAAKPLTIISAAPLSVTTQTIPAGTVGANFSQALLATGGVPPYTWSVVNGQPPLGLTLDPTSGTLAGTPTQTGTFVFVAQVRDNAGATATRNLSLNIAAINSNTLLTVFPMALEFNAAITGDNPPPQSVFLLSPNDAPQNFAVVTDGGSAGTPAGKWLTVHPLSGAAPARLTVSADQTGLAEGTYTSRIRVSVVSSAGGQQIPIDVLVSLNVKTVPQTLDVIPSALRFSAFLGGTTPQDQAILIRNRGGSGPIPFSISVLSNSPWLTAITPTSGRTAPNRPQLVNIRVNPRGLGAGTNRAVVRVTSAAGTRDVVVLLFVSETGAIIRVAPTGGRYELQQGSTSARGQSIKIFNSGIPGSVVTWTASLLTGNEWLALGSAQGTAVPGRPGRLVLQPGANIPNLPPKTYYGLVRITDPQALNSPQYFTAVLNILSATTPVTPILSDQGLVFTATASGAQPPPQVVQIGATSNALVAYQASTSTDDGAAWLSVKPSSGTISDRTLANAAVTVNTTGLTPGIYHGQVDVSIAGTLRGVNVTLIVAPAATAATKINAAAGCTPTKLAVTHTGLGSGFSAPAKWPVYLEVRLVDSCGEPVTNGQVLVNFSNGDPPIGMEPNDDQPGVFSATWPPNKASTTMSVTATAIAPPFDSATADVIGAVTENKAPSLNADGTVHNFRPLYSGGALAPGTIISIYGSNLAAATASPASTPLPTSFNGTTVLIGGIEAPLFYISSDQINAQIPTELKPNRLAKIIVSANGALTLPDTLAITDVQPGVAAFDDGRLIAQHLDYSLVTADKPAAPGETMTIYLGGLGPTNPAVLAGAAAPGAAGLARVLNIPEVLINGARAQIPFAGLVPGAVGLYQINFVVPADTLAGSATVTLTQNGIEGNATTLPVKR